ncbi:MAG: Phosphatidylinositol-4-phosphate 5-kinase [Candelina mexicana]|nr:MAG: Phosphatidylinositol-4-phosphate 5-kinase [Candelina mexicana]
MPSFLNEGGTTTLVRPMRLYHEPEEVPPPERASQDYPSSKVSLMNRFYHGDINDQRQMNGAPLDEKGSTPLSLPNGRMSGTSHMSEKQRSRQDSAISSTSAGEVRQNGRGSPEPPKGLSKVGVGMSTYLSGIPHRTHEKHARPNSPALMIMDSVDGLVPSRIDSNAQTSNHDTIVAPTSAPLSSAPAEFTTLKPETGPPHRFSSPPAPSSTPTTFSTTSSQVQLPPRLQKRHTLQVPKPPPSRNSRDFPTSRPTSEDTGTNGGRFSPTEGGKRRASMTLGRRATRSIHSDVPIDDVPQDDDAARWTEVMKQKRASRRKRKEEEDDDRVVVGTKVDMNHVNWVTAYNMLTGIRFTVSRTNAKIDRELTDADFDAKHKFSFDITGNELTPSAKYDFKFKDYAPWIFRHLRAKFNLDPADYLMSLTSKYILSELGSPGKSGSFFYFSRDYKYIIKTIRHAEHKVLLRILRDYYAHVEKNPNTLLSQFYGLHRVKIPYGRKIHFVVMNNLFPPHRDIHQTFDLKGSTIGREFKEQFLEKNPRATLKDMNWLRRGLHLELGRDKKRVFVAQVERDVKFLQHSKIMDYSMLVGIHDMGKGNEENLREKRLQVFQPGGERAEEPQPNTLMRTPSKLENARKARELRQIIKKEKPIPMDKSTSKMPDEMLDERKNFIFYSDDGGFRATHEDGEPGEAIYYLGIIDCLTHYGFIKKAEHIWKGMDRKKIPQISPIRPEPYGDRFVKFIAGITKSREEIELEKTSSTAQPDGSLDTVRNSGQHLFQRPSSEKVVARAEKQAEKSKKGAASEEGLPERALSATQTPALERTSGGAGATLPVVEEAAEAGSTGGRSGRSRDESVQNGKTEGSSSPRLEKVEPNPPLIPQEDTAVEGRSSPTPPLSTPSLPSTSPLNASGADDLKLKVAKIVAAPVVDNSAQAITAAQTASIAS